MSVNPPPIQNRMVDDKGIATFPWILFFSQLFQGDSGLEWAPTFVNLTEVGVPAISGQFYKLNEAISFFSLNIIPDTNTSSVAGTTYIDNFPLTMTADGVCFAVSGNLGAVPGMCDRATNRIYVPAWTTVSIPLTVLGIVEAS